MKIEIIGEVAFVGETAEVGMNKFQVREILLTTDKDEEYPQLISVQAVGGKVSIFDDLTVGDEVVVKASLNGRPYQAVNKPKSAINQINAWKVDVTKKSETATPVVSCGSIVVDPAIPAAPIGTIPF